jgi:hypothetical protein
MNNNDNVIEKDLALSPDSPGLLALHLHQQKTQDLEIEVSDEFIQTNEGGGEGWSVRDKKLIFNSLEARNEVLVHELYGRHFAQPHIDTFLLFRTCTLLRRKESHHNKDLASARLIAQVAKNLDIFLLAEKVLTQVDNVFMDVLWHIKTAFPLMSPEQVEIASVISFFKAQHDLTKNDLAAGDLYSSFAQWLKDYPSVALNLYNKTITACDDIDANLSGIAVMAIAASDSAQSLRLISENAASEDIYRRKVAVHCAGRLLCEHKDNLTSETCKETESIICKGLDEEHRELQIVAINSASRLLDQTTVFDNQLAKLAMGGDQAAAGAIGQALFSLKQKLLEQGKFFNWLNYVVVLEPNAVHETLDYMLSEFITQDCETQRSVISFLEQWAIKNSDTVMTLENDGFSKIFQETVSKIYENDVLLSWLVTRWLSAEEPALAYCAHSLFHWMYVHDGKKTVVFDVALLNQMEKEDVLFLVRRTLGFAALYEKQLLSLMLSFFEVSEDLLKKIFGILAEVFIHFLGRDYSGQTVEALKTYAEQLQEGNLKDLVRQITQPIEEWMLALNGLPVIEELKPPQNALRAFRLIRMKEEQKSHDQIQQESIMNQLATNIPVKAGLGTLIYRDGKYDDEVSLFHSYTRSFVLPSRSIYDEVGAHIDFHSFCSLRKCIL